MKTIHDPSHPIWATIRVVVIAICVTLVLALNADNFDATELRSIAWIIPSLIGIEGVTKVLSKPPTNE